MEKKDKEMILNSIKGTWYADKDNEDILFFKHVNSNKTNKIFQVILSNSEYDGVYALYTTNNSFEGRIDNDVILISNGGNLDYAMFKPEKKVLPKGYLNPEYCRAYGYCVIRGEYENEQTFKEALLKTGLISEEEYDIYTYSNSKEYIFNKTPKLKVV